jgi:hypothetical protein
MSMHQFKVLTHTLTIALSWLLVVKILITKQEILLALNQFPVLAQLD